MNVYSEEKKESKYIYFFSEANKFRLLGENEKAKQNYLSALQLNKESAVSFFYLAVLFSSEKQYQTALEFAKKAVKLQSDNKWYVLAEADMLSFTGNYDQAVNIYKELLKNDPQNEMLFGRLEKVYTERNDPVSLAELYSSYLKNNDFDNELAIKLYEIYRTQSKRKEAEGILIQLSRFNNNSPKYKALLAEFYMSTNRNEQAAELYNELLIEYPQNQDVLLSYAYYCKYSGNKNEYFHSVKTLMASDFDINTKINLIISGQYPNFPKHQYLELLNALYLVHSDDIQANTIFAEYYIENNETEKAIEYIKKAVEINKNDFNLILALFELYYQKEDFINLYGESENLKIIYPNRPKVFLYNGIAAFKTEKYEKAVESLSYGKDILIDDKLMEVQFNFYLAESYKKLNSFDKAEKYYKETLKLNESFKPAMISYSIYLSEENRYLQKAEELAYKCYMQNNEDKAFQFAYALALFKQQKNNEAFSISKNLITNSDNPVYLELHGDILFVLNNKAEALKFWKLALDKGSKNIDLKLKIKNIDKLKIEDFLKK